MISLDIQTEPRETKHVTLSRVTVGTQPSKSYTAVDKPRILIRGHRCHLPLEEYISGHIRFVPWQRMSMEPAIWSVVHGLLSRSR